MLHDNYTWAKSKRRRTIALMIGSEGELIVKTPLFTSKKVVEDFILSKTSWIKKQQERQKERIHPLLPSFQSSGILHLFGEKIPFVCLAQPGAKIIEESGSITVHAKNENLFNKTLTQWYSKKTEEKVDYYLSLYRQRLMKQPKSVGFKRYRRKWGSCDHKNNLMFNKLLAKHPLHHIEYVVVHELAHIIEKHHRKSFWDHGESLMQGFKKIHKDML